MEIELKKLYQHESRVGTFCVGQRNPRAPHANFGCNRCSICDEQKRIKGGHFVGQNLRRGVKGKFVCDDCRKKDGDGMTAHNVELSGPTAALSPEGPAQTQGSASD